MQHDSPINDVQQQLEQTRDQRVAELQELLLIPSVSAVSAHHDDCREAANWVHKQLAACGFETETVETDGLPIVSAEWTKAKGAPTALVYGHYDVQPPDPLNEWTTPPFEPTIRDGCLFARGATDDKGQVFTHIKSVAAWLDATGKLPINVKFVIEGEEEVGSNNLEKFLESHKYRLACDIAVISDTAQYGNGIPAITYGLRGILACEVILHGPHQDLHSGVFGGAITNPVNALAKMLGTLHDDDGRIQIPGFYDDVIPLTDEERRAFADLPFDEQAYCKSLGIDAVAGEAGYTTLERRWARPTCDINGFFGGYQGEGPKTIIPAKATAKITCRLVPGQDAHQLTQALEHFLREQCPPGVRFEFKTYHGAPAVLCDTSSPYMAAARKAVEAGFGQTPVMIREGGSIPVVGSFKQILGVDTLLLGWGRNTDNLHGPNEHFHLEDFHHGTLASAHLWAALSQ
ncbi:MAG: dipeptidase [Planctomycetaceae bacterium]